MTFGAFVQKVLGRSLWPHQEEAAASTAFITTIAAARRTGKTTLIEWLSIFTAFSERDVVVVILSATQDASRRVTESILQTLSATDLTAGSVQDGHATRIRLTNGSQIVSLPASQRQVRGYGKGVKLLVIDEAGFVTNELWQAAHYIALDERRNGSRVILCGTPWGGPEMFFRRAFDAGNDGDPDHAAFNWRHTVNPLLDHAYLERQRDRVSPAEFAAEVLGEWSDATGSLFSRELLERQTADLELPTIRQVRGPARPAVGFDHGVSFDRSSLVQVYRLPVGALNGNSGRSGFSGIPDEITPRFVAIPHVWPAKTPLSDTVRDVVALGTVPFVVSSETNGVGAMPSQELQRLMAGRRPQLRVTWNMVATTSAKKTAGYGAVLGLLERSQLVLPRDPDLLRQLAGLRFEQGERGFTRIEAEDAATHDDVADALMLAMGPYSQRTGRGRVLTAMLKYADPTAAPADFVRSDWGRDAEVVTTGAGLKVWRTPALQSVFGREVTYPLQAPEQAAPQPPEAPGPSRENSFAGLSRATWAP